MIFKSVVSCWLKHLPRLTISKQSDDLGHIRVVFIVSFDEDVLTYVNDRSLRETVHVDGQRSAMDTKQKTNINK